MRLLLRKTGDVSQINVDDRWLLGIDEPLKGVTDLQGLDEELNHIVELKFVEIIGDLNYPFSSNKLVNSMYSCTELLEH